MVNTPKIVGNGKYPQFRKYTPRNTPTGSWLPQYAIGRKKTKTADFSAACLDSLDCIGCLRIGTWWAQQDSNLRLPPCEGGTLPLSYAPGTTQDAHPASGNTVPNIAKSEWVQDEIPVSPGQVATRRAPSLQPRNSCCTPPRQPLASAQYNSQARMPARPQDPHRPHAPSDPAGTAPHGDPDTLPARPARR